MFSSSKCVHNLCINATKLMTSTMHCTSRSAAFSLRSRRGAVVHGIASLRAVRALYASGSASSGEGNYAAVWKRLQPMPFKFKKGAAMFTGNAVVLFHSGGGGAKGVFKTGIGVHQFKGGEWTEIKTKSRGSGSAGGNVLTSLGKSSMPSSVDGIAAINSFQLLLYGGAPIMVKRKGLFLYDLELKECQPLMSSGASKGEKEKVRMPFEKAKMAHVFAEQKVYLFGESYYDVSNDNPMSVAVFDIRTKQGFDVLDSVSGEAPRERVHSIVGTANHEIYVLTSPTSADVMDLHIFNPARSEWRRADAFGDVPPPLRGATLSSFRTPDGRDKLLLFGGYHVDYGVVRNFCNDVYLLDIESNEWQLARADGDVDDTPVPRADMAMAEISDSSLLMLGGANAFDMLNDTFLLEIKVV